jgi:hypothetical protein
MAFPQARTAAFNDRGFRAFLSDTRSAAPAISSVAISRDVCMGAGFFNPSP